MSTPLVSILIPCYNAAPWLGATLESALAQTYPAIEVVVVNDGSTDRSAEIARSFSSRGVHVIDQPNAGQSAAFNRAIRAARGAYYEFLDADDLIAPDKIECQIRRIQQLPSDWLATGAWGRFFHSPDEAEFAPGPVARDLAPVEWVTALWRSGSMMHGAAWLVPANLVSRAGLWNEQLSLINDFEFFSRLVLASAGVAYCADARSYYRSGLSSSLSGQRTVVAWQSAFDAVRLGTERFLASEDTRDSRAACAHVWRMLAFDCSVDAPELSRQAEERVHQLGEELGRPVGGVWFRLASSLLGWRAARRWQRWRALRTNGPASRRSTQEA